MYFHCRALTELVIIKLHVTKTQSKLVTFFKPTMPFKPPSPHPITSVAGDIIVLDTDSTVDIQEQGSSSTSNVE
jgi:hypothetical protein